MTQIPGGEPVESPDGKFLYYERDQTAFGEFRQTAARKPLSSIPCIL